MRVEVATELTRAAAQIARAAVKSAEGATSEEVGWSRCTRMVSPRTGTVGFLVARQTTGWSLISTGLRQWEFCGAVEPLAPNKAIGTAASMTSSSKQSSS